jgi:hypothetical protein
MRGEGGHQRQQTHDEDGKQGMTHGGDKLLGSKAKFVGTIGRSERHSRWERGNFANLKREQRWARGSKSLAMSATCIGAL